MDWLQQLAYGTLPTPFFELDGGLAPEQMMRRAPGPALVLGGLGLVALGLAGARAAGIPLAAAAAPWPTRTPAQPRLGSLRTVRTPR